MSIIIKNMAGKEKPVSVFKTGVIVTLVFSFFFVLQGCGNSEERTLASVGSNKITEDQFEKRYSDYIVFSGTKDNPRVRTAILNNMINEILLKEYDNNDNIYNDPEYKKEKEWTFKQALLAFLKDREVYQNITVSDSEVRDAFVKLNQKISARHLYAKTKEEADQLYQLLQTGARFEDLAKQVFTDSTLRNNGGNVGYFTWGEMDPAFEDVAYSLKTGEISKPVKTRTGYSIIKVEDKTSSPLLTEYQFLQKKSDIKTTLKIRKKKPDEQKFIDSYFDKDQLKINDKPLKEILPYLTDQNFTPEVTDNIKNEVAASYKNTKVYAADLLKRIYNLPAYHRNNIRSLPALKAAIEGFFVQDILVDAAKEKGYDKSKIMLDTYDEMTNNLYLKFKMKEVAGKASVADSSLQKFYEDNIEYFSTHNEINIREIIVEEKSTARKLLNRIQNGEDFGKLARSYSLRKWSAENNGELGYAPLNKFGMFQKDFWNASIGDVIGPKNFNDYFGLFKIIGKHKSRPIEFDKIKNEIESAYRQNNQSQLLLNFVEKLKKKTDVTVYENKLRSLDLNLL